MMSNSQQPTIQEKVTSKWFSELPADILGGQGNVRDKDSEETKEREGKVTSRVVAVPCRARGMTMDHNFQSAHFQIPEDIQHGDFLVCSHLPCRNRGVKFLYCAFCKDAVAKRNFRKRHQHEQSENSGVKMVDSARAVHWVGAGGTKEASGQLQAALISGSCSHPSEESQSGSGSTLTNSHEAGRKRLASVIAMRTDLRAKLAKLEPKRKEAWDLLLASRPDTAQSNKMSAWLMHIMALSDKAKPLSEDPIEAVLKTSETAESPNNDPAASSMSNDSGNETSRDSAQSNAMANGVAQHSRKRKAASCLSPQTTDGSSNYESNETSSDTQSNEYSNSRNSSERSSDTQSNDSSSDNQERTTSNDSSSEN